MYMVLGIDAGPRIIPNQTLGAGRLFYRAISPPPACYVSLCVSILLIFEFLILMVGTFTGSLYVF